MSDSSNPSTGPNNGSEYQESWSNPGPAACTADLAARVKRRLTSPEPADLACAALAGLAIGYLLFSSRRPQGIREAFLGNVIPFARGHVHDAYEAVAHGKHLEPLRRRMSKMSMPW